MQTLLRAFEPEQGPCELKFANGFPGERGCRARYPKPDSDPDAAERSHSMFYSELLHLFCFLIKLILKVHAEIAEALHAGHT